MRGPSCFYLELGSDGGTPSSCKKCSDGEYQHDEYEFVEECRIDTVDHGKAEQYPDDGTGDGTERGRNQIGREHAVFPQHEKGNTAGNGCGCVDYGQNTFLLPAPEYGGHDDYRTSHACRAQEYAAEQTCWNQYPYRSPHGEMQFGGKELYGQEEEYACGGKTEDDAYGGYSQDGNAYGGTYHIGDGDDGEFFHG